jgi:predicted CxxxxCH...CXXCH cytochrome family protein
MAARRPGRSLQPLILLLLLPVVALAGCSASNVSGVGFLDAEGNHPANIVTTHPAFARPDGSACFPCHGGDLQGGISGVSCFTASRDGVSCHALGPAFHPVRWLDRALRGTKDWHATAYETDVLIRDFSCADCHTPPALDAPDGKCRLCHFDADGRRVPAGSSYVHGQIGGHTAFPTDNTACVNCHATNNRFGHPPSCHNCHDPFPGAFHPSGWSAPATHGPPAKAAPGGTNGFAYCQTCHGTLFSGGTVQVDCFVCHGINAPHPRRPWRAAGADNTHTNVDDGNASVCALCHTLGANSTRQPDPPAPPGTGPGCFNNTLCHGQLGAAPHAVRPYNAHPQDARTQFDTSCNVCHSMSLPRLDASAPACTECHPGGNPLTVGDCTSCHASPPDGAAPVGSVFPNVAGAHAAHDALAEVKGICNICHSGAGTGTGLNHFYDGAVDVAFAGATYQAKAGAVSFTATDNSCANVSCHGGIRTPNWRTGSIDVNTDAGCLQCHQKGSSAGVPENNSYFSGRHDRHESEGIGCTECHDMTLDTQGALSHFTFLSTPQMEGPASDTFRNEDIVYTPGPPGPGRCTGVCHGRDHNNRPW